MPEKINKKKEIKTNSDVYEIYLGTFNDDVFTWYSIKKFKDATQAYKEFKKYVNTQLKYTDEELKKVWDTGRLDIELRQGNKLLNWVGIYSREVKNLSEKEEKEAESGKVKKDSVSEFEKYSPSEVFKKYFYDPNKLTHDSDDEYYCCCDKIQFFINSPKGNRIPSNEYNFFDCLQNLGLSLEEDLSVYSDSEEECRSVLSKVGKFIVDYYLPQNNFMFKDVDLSYGDTVAIKFIKPAVLDSDLDPIKVFKPDMRINYKKPYGKDEDLWYKTTGETFEQSYNKYNNY